MVVENRQNGKTPVGPVRLPHAKFVEEDILVGENVAEHIRITAVDSRGQPIASKRRILVIPVRAIDALPALPGVGRCSCLCTVQC